MKQHVSDELALLHTSQLNLVGSKSLASRERDEAIKTLNKRANELKSDIDTKADELRRRIQLSSDEQIRKLDGALQSIKGKSTTGHSLNLDIGNRPRNSKSQAIQHIIKLKQRVADFQISSSEERDKMVDYTVTSFKPGPNQFSNFNPIGELIPHQKVIQEQDEQVDRLRCKTSEPSACLCVRLASSQKSHFVAKVKCSSCKRIETIHTEACFRCN